MLRPEGVPTLVGLARLDEQRMSYCKNSPGGSE